MTVERIAQQAMKPRDERIETLAQQGRDERLTRKEAAAYLRSNEHSMKHWAYLGIGPRYARIGTRVFYRKSDLDSWLDERFEGGEAA